MARQEPEQLTKPPKATPGNTWIEFVGGPWCGLAMQVPLPTERVFIDRIMPSLRRWDRPLEGPATDQAQYYITPQRCPRHLRLIAEFIRQEGKP